MSPAALQAADERMSPETKSSPSESHSSPVATQLYNAGRKPKQKRNKPTLSCGECVERKTKCDRVRPACLACIKRQSVCQYSTIADILAAADPKGASPHRSRKLGRANKHGDVQKCTIASITNPPSPQHSPKAPPYRFAQPESTVVRRQSTSNRERPAPFNVFGMGSQHPFHNYWTCTGGLPEVISVLPSKDQADLLVTKYFEVVDPLYPIIGRAEFDVDYERFWSIPLEQQCEFDAATLALHFVVYATGTQFMSVSPLDERVRTAEFYLSASHQALRISSYLTRLSLPTIQAMVLICYFLVNDNHVSDAWTFSGITLRQAYALELNRDPDLVSTGSSFLEKQQRAKLWQAIMYQDTGLSLYLKLPPTTQYYDIRPRCLRYSQNDQVNGTESYDQTGLSSILRACLPYEAALDRDLAYLRCGWEYAAFTQIHICIPRSLNQPLSKDPATKARLISQYRSMFDSWVSPFNSHDQLRYAASDQRTARQLIALGSSYFYVLMVLCMDENPSAGVKCDEDGALDAGHEALGAFFALVRLWPDEVDTWWAYHTRAYAQASMVANILAIQKQSTLPDGAPSKPIRAGSVSSDGSNVSSKPQKSAAAAHHARLVQGKADLDAYLEILENAQGTADYERIQRGRAMSLRDLRNCITVV